MREFAEYWCVLFRTTFRHSLDQTQYVIFGLLIATGFLGWLFPLPAMILRLLGYSVNVGGWQIAAVVFGTIIVIRLVLAPVWIHSEQKQTILALQRAMKPLIRVFLEAPENGVHNFPCLDGSLSRYVQFTVSPATDAPLIGCEVRLESVTRLNADGTITPLPEEHIHCRWSNLPVLALDIAPRVQHRANLFFVNDRHEDLLHVETVPVKIRLPAEIQMKGRYRISVNVVAKDAPTRPAAFLFSWNGFDDMSLVQEA